MITTSFSQRHSHDKTGFLNNQNKLQDGETKKEDSVSCKNMTKQQRYADADGQLTKNPKNDLSCLQASNFKDSSFVA